MAKTWTELRDILLEVLGSEYVYYSPPANVQLHFPCIIFSLEDILHVHANNRVYKRDNRYSLTVIDPNPDSEVVKKVDELPYCSMSRTYKANNLNYFVFTIYF